jgi:hypothetical protein
VKVERILNAVFQYEAKAAMMRQFDIEFDNPSPERPAWMKPRDWKKVCDDAHAHVLTLIWRAVPDDYRLGVHDLLTYRCPEGRSEKGSGLFALTDPAHTTRA